MKLNSLIKDGHATFSTPRERGWHSGRAISLQVEVDLLAPVLEQAGEQFTLLGHMGPVTHADAVKEAISGFFEEVCLRLAHTHAQTTTPYRSIELNHL